VPEEVLSIARVAPKIWNSYSPDTAYNWCDWSG